MVRRTGKVIIHAPGEFGFAVIWKEQAVLVVGAASSRDHLISRLEAAPTGVFLW